MVSVLTHFFNSGQVGWLGLVLIPLPIAIVVTVLRKPATP
jgi:hypothetical protein